MNIVSVKPMSKPSGNLFYMNYKYDDWDFKFREQIVWENDFIKLVEDAGLIHIYDMMKVPMIRFLYSLIGVDFIANESQIELIKQKLIMLKNLKKL